ncbi:MAG: hypothetical protein LBG59_02390 [Candidatus Peribacteria bacterium]|nr:hypothetical protein [Candidatus Peribacteria bacterium]
MGKANELLKQYGTSIPRKVLDEIRQDSEDVGYTMNYEGFYYPRKVENPQEFIEMIFKSENPAVVSVIEERIRQLEEKN